VTWETDLDMCVSKGLEADIRDPFQGSVGHFPGEIRKSTENLLIQDYNDATTLTASVFTTLSVHYNNNVRWTTYINTDITS
jgi:hypothetical protein